MRRLASDCAGLTTVFSYEPSPVLIPYGTAEIGSGQFSRYLPVHASFHILIASLIQMALFFKHLEFVDGDCKFILTFFFNL